MADACLLSDEQSFSLGHRDTPGQPWGSNEMAAEHIHGALQPPAQRIECVEYDNIIN